MVIFKQAVIFFKQFENVDIKVLPIIQMKVLSIMSPVKY